MGQREMPVVSKVREKPKLLIAPGNQWVRRLKIAAREKKGSFPNGTGLAVFRETGRDGRSAPSVLWDRFIYRRRPMPMAVGIQLGRREGSTFSLDRAAPFSGRLGTGAKRR